MDQARFDWSRQGSAKLHLPYTDTSVGEKLNKVLRPQGSAELWIAFARVIAR